jgi:hypothetical protein
MAEESVRKKNGNKLLSAGTHWVKEKFALKIVAISRYKHSASFSSCAGC